MDSAGIVKWSEGVRSAALPKALAGRNGRRFFVDILDTPCHNRGAPASMALTNAIREETGSCRRNGMIDRRLQQEAREGISLMRLLADQAFARTAGAPLVSGNSVRLLKNAAENYPAWLEAIHAAKQAIAFES